MSTVECRSTTLFICLKAETLKPKWTKGQHQNHSKGNVDSDSYTDKRKSNSNPRSKGSNIGSNSGTNSRHNNSGSGYVLCLEFQKQPETQDEMTAIETHTWGWELAGALFLCINHGSSGPSSSSARYTARTTRRGPKGGRSSPLSSWHLSRRHNRFVLLNSVSWF